jgi:hypothetical protein
MNDHDYDMLLHTGGAPPAHPHGHPHALTMGHPAPAPHPAHAVQHAPVHETHVVHDARHPGPTHIVYTHAPPPVAPHPHLVHEAYPYPPQHSFEHEPHRGYSEHRPHAHSHEHRERRHDDDDRPRRRPSKHQTSAEDIRTFPIGFKMTGIAGGDVEDIEVKPQVRFQGRRLAIAQSIARYFDIVDIKVGKDSQLAATGELSGEALSALAVDVRVELDPAPPGIVITLSVRNNDAVAHDFRAVLYGLVEEVDD